MTSVSVCSLVYDKAEQKALSCIRTAMSDVISIRSFATKEYPCMSILYVEGQEAEAMFVVRSGSVCTLASENSGGFSVTHPMDAPH